MARGVCIRVGSSKTPEILSPGKAGQADLVFPQASARLVMREPSRA